MFDLSIYHINFSTLISWLVPSFLRTPIRLAWIKVFLGPMETFFNKKRVYRDKIRYKLAHSGRVIYLEKVLNEYYNIAGYNHQDHQGTKKIYLGAGERLNPLYVYREIEQQSNYTYTQAEVDVDSTKAKYLYTQAEIDDAYADFTILVPASLSFFEDELRSVVDEYTNTKLYLVKTY